MSPALTLLQMDRLDWAAFALLALIFGGFLLAFSLYLRTAYKSGGWKRVRWASYTAMVTIALFFLEMIRGNYEVNLILGFLGRCFEWALREVG